MNRFVLDASVVVKWVVKEVFQEEARQYWREDLTLLAPGLLLLECAGAIQKKVWQNEISGEEGWKAYEILSAYEGLIFTPTDDLMRPAYDLANQLTHSIYDCLYLALAIQSDAVVITADRKFYRRLKDSHYSKQIAWIEDPLKVSK